MIRNECLGPTGHDQLGYGGHKMQKQYQKSPHSGPIVVLLASIYKAMK